MNLFLGAHELDQKVNKVKVAYLQSGLSSDLEQVNFYKAQQVGMARLSRIVGTTFGEVSFKKKYNVVSLASDKNTLKAGEKKIAVDPLTLYHRMCIAKTTQEDIKE